MGLMTSAGLMFMLQTMLPTTGTLVGQKVSYLVEGVEQKVSNKECHLKVNPEEDSYELSMTLKSSVESQLGLIFDEEELGEEATFTTELLPSGAVSIKQDFSDSSISVLLEKTAEQQFSATLKSVGAGDAVQLKCEFKN